jgi:hypothetical protein
MSWGPGDWLLEHLPRLDAYLQTVQVWTAPPSRAISRWDGGQWRRVNSDDAPNLYRYETRIGRRFGWRDPNGVLYEVDERVGCFLAVKYGTADMANTDTALVWTGPEMSLRVPRSMKLPPLVARALVLRTGLLPQQATRINAHGAGQKSLEFLNVGLEEALRVGGLLSVEVRDESGVALDRPR